MIVVEPAGAGLRAEANAERQLNDVAEAVGGHLRLAGEEVDVHASRQLAGRVQDAAAEGEGSLGGGGVLAPSPNPRLDSNRAGR